MSISAFNSKMDVEVFAWTRAFWAIADFLSCLENLPDQVFLSKKRLRAQRTSTEMGCKVPGMDGKSL